MGSEYHVPSTELEIEFKPTADLVIITNEENSTRVEMTMQDWSELVERARAARSLAI